MTASTVAINNLASVEFQNGVYGTISMAARLAVAVTSRAQAMRVAWYLRRVNKNVKSLLDLVDESLSGKRPLQKNEEMTPQKLRELADTVDYMVRVMEYQYESMRRARLTNNSLTAGALKMFQSNLDPLKDLADWIDVAAKPEDLDAIFARSKAEMERGEVYEVKRVE
jgi:hypothetical protein